MSAYKRAALYLHGLSNRDRDWVLSKLPGNDRSKIGEFLESLLHLGIPADRSLLAEIETLQSSVATGKSDSSSIDFAIIKIDQSSLTQISDLLENESPVLVSALLSCREWCWKTVFIDRFGMQNSSHLTSDVGVEPPKISERIKNSIIENLAQKIEEQESLFNSVDLFNSKAQFESEMEKQNSKKRFWG
ncbi:MAG: hypothetical protein RPU52_11970 [Candidatus Sedimenticola sp. (ex Thyasira tokunagai)]